MRSWPPRALLLAVLVAACSGGETAPHQQKPAPTVEAEIQARFEPASSGAPLFLDVPFPSDVYLDPDGTIVDTIPGLDAYVTRNTIAISGALASQRGFSVNSGAFFRIDRPAKDGVAAAPVIDPGSLPEGDACGGEGSSVFLVDLDADAKHASIPCRAAFHDDRPAGSDRPPVLAVLPARGVVLAEGHRHAAVLTTKVTAAGGKALGPSGAFRAIRDGGRRGTALEKLTGGAIDEVVKKVPALGGKERIAGLTVFTTQATAGELVAMREATAALPPPELSWDPAAIAPMHAALFTAQPVAGATATLDDWLGQPDKLPDGTDDPARDQSQGAAHDAIAAMGTAVYESPNFLLERPGGYQDLAHATVARDGAGKPIVNPDKPVNKIWVTIALPKGSVPPGGFPAIIIQHGLQGDRGFLLALANTYAQQGWATVAIEAVTFGARALSPADTVDAVSTFPWSNKAKYAGPDGFVDQLATAPDSFGDFYSFGAARDQLRQTVVDLATLGDVVRDPALDLGPMLAAVPGAKLDPARVGYFGDSFGAVAGSMVAAIDPHLQAFVLNVGGGGILCELVANAPYLASLVGTVGALTFGVAGDRLDASHPLVGLLQSILDPADPLTHARRIALDPATFSGKPNPPKSVILIEAVWDEIVANEGSEALARAAGMPLAAPNVGPNAGVPLAEAQPVGGVISGVPVAGATAVLVQASPGSHGSDFYNARGARHFAIPFGQPGLTPFPTLPADLPVVEPYLGLQRMSVGFFRTLFDGKIPDVGSIPAPARDFDGDGVDDSQDADPLDPAKK